MPALHLGPRCNPSKREAALGLHTGAFGRRARRRVRAARATQPPTTCALPTLVDTASLFPQAVLWPLLACASAEARWSLLDFH
eukprot:6198924-Pleurochrysis_carterae.AAC.3